MEVKHVSKYERFDYVPVECLERGMTIVNLGIIDQIYPHKDKNEYQIIFKPARVLNITSHFFKKDDKLMIA